MKKPYDKPMLVRRHKLENIVAAISQPPLSKTAP